jgi:hypothetical protein
MKQTVQRNIKTLVFVLFLFVLKANAQVTTIADLSSAGVNIWQNNGFTSDQSGNIYFWGLDGSNNNNNVIYKESGGAVTSIYNAGNSSNPQGLAVDGNNNLYYLDYNYSTNNNELQEVTGGNLTTLATLNNIELGGPWGVSIVIDGNNNVYFWGQDNNAGNTILYQVTQSGNVNTAYNAGNNYYYTQSLAVDASNNFYFEAYGPGTSYNQVLLELTSGGSINTIVSNFQPNYNTSLTVDGSGNVYYWGHDNSYYNVLYKVSQSSNTPAVVQNMGNSDNLIGLAISGNSNFYYTDQNPSSGDMYLNELSLYPLPTITASGDITFCSGGSVTLTASEGYSYLWSNGATSQSITVTTTGAYTVTVSDINGNSSTSAATSVTVNPMPTPTITANGATTFSSGGSVTLNTGNALTFNGSNYIDVPNSSTLNFGTSTDYTFEAWAILNGDQPNFEGIVCKGSSVPTAQPSHNWQSITTALPGRYIPHQVL